jgi:hypothetical protein
VIVIAKGVQSCGAKHRQWVKHIAAYLSADGAAVSGYEPERVELAGQVEKTRGSWRKLNFLFLTSNESLSA